MAELVRTTALFDRGHRIRYWTITAGLVVVALGLIVGILSYENPAPFGSAGYWRIAELRATSILVIIVVAFCQAFATVSFQTAANNRIITPSIMGFEALYVAVQTTSVFLFGAAGLILASGVGAFAAQAALMIGFACALYGWLLSGRFGNVHVMLLIGVVIGGGLRSLATFMQRLLTPSEFDILTARLFGSIGNAEVEYLPLAIPIALAAGIALWLRARRLNVIALGRDTAENLGLNHRRELMVTLFLVSVLMAMTTALVGPMTFLGFLVALLAYQFADTYEHRLLLPMAFLVGVVVLAGSYFLLRHVFDAQGAVTIIIELIGGLVFLAYIMRKGRL